MRFFMQQILFCSNPLLIMSIFEYSFGIEIYYDIGIILLRYGEMLFRGRGFNAGLR